MKRKIFNIIQIGDKSNRVSRAFDIFITITIFANILVTFLQTFRGAFTPLSALHLVEGITLAIFCVEYALRIWTADYIYPNRSEWKSRFHFLFSFDGIVDLLTIIPAFFLSGFVIFRMLRVARIFHLFRLNAKYDSFNVITTVLYEKRNQIISSVFIVMILMFASSMCMYSVEHEAQPRGLSKCVQRDLVEHVHTAYRRLRRYLPGDNAGALYGDCDRISGRRRCSDTLPVLLAPVSWSSTSGRAESPA